MEIRIEIDDLVGYEIIKNGKTTQWEDLTRKEQISILNAFAGGYDLFRPSLKEE